MISYGKQTIDEKDIDSIVEVLNSDWLTQGPAVEQFETNLKEYFGSKYACAVSNGTAALHLCGLALGWKKEDIILTSPLTFLATANSIIYCGATPDFVDINPKTYTIDPNLVEDKIKAYQKQGKKIKGIIGVDYAGHPCDWRALRQIANKYNLQLVNDNCHALGASYFNDKQYALKYADVVTQSYHPVKHITTGEGGSILTNDSGLDEKMRYFRSHGMIKQDELISQYGSWYYEMHQLGFNYRITDFQCALGSNQLNRLDSFISKRRKIAESYDSLLNLNPEIACIPKVSKNIEHAYHLYPYQIDFESIELDKRELFSRMKKSGVLLQVHYIPVHLQPYYQKNYGFKKNDFPISESFYSKEVSLPIYPTLSLKDQDIVTSSLTKIIFQ